MFYSSNSLWLFRHILPFCIATLLFQYTIMILSCIPPQKIYSYPRHPGTGNNPFIWLFSHFSKNTESFLILDTFIFYFIQVSQQPYELHMRLISLPIKKLLIRILNNCSISRVARDEERIQIQVYLLLKLIFILL